MTSNIINKIIHRIGIILCKFRGLRFFDFFESAVDSFHRGLNNVNFNMNNNGELRVLDLLSIIEPKCVFDVGANNGEWSILFNDMYKKCLIYAFEIVPSTYENLVKKSTNTRIIPSNIGLSNENAIISIHLGKNLTVATGCKLQGMKFHDDYYDKQIACEVRKASDIMEQLDISIIDFLKIDVEGMDFKVIQGFGKKIRSVRVIQFEYGIFNISSHDLLYDFCKYFNDNGFIVGKIFPQHVEFFQYHFIRENFHGSNYIAINKNERQLIKKLSRRGV